MILSRGQQVVLNQLHKISKVALDKSTHSSLPIQPRTHTLICGPSGVGKSHLCRELAKELELEVLILNCSNWQPNGSKADIYTWVGIVRFLENNEKGIIVLDEVDKISGTSEWHGYIRLEIHDLLDGIIPTNFEVSPIVSDEEAELCLWGDDEEKTPKLKPDDRTKLSLKLKNHFMIVGAGAWQHLWELNETPSMGFGATNQELAMKKPSQEELKSSIYPEVLKRFQSTIQIIDPMDRNDYIALITETAKSLDKKYQRYFVEEAVKGVDEAVSSQAGLRWVEELILDTLMNAEKPTPKQELALRLEHLFTNEACDQIRANPLPKEVTQEQWLDMMRKPQTDDNAPST